MGNYATALTGSPQRPRKPPQRRPLAAASSPLATASTPSTDFTMRQHLQLLQPLQSCNSAIGAIDAIRNTKQLAVIRPTLPRPDLLAVIVSTEPPRCHQWTSRRHDGQLFHRPDWMPTAATQTALFACANKKVHTKRQKKKNQKEILVIQMG